MGALAPAAGDAPESKPADRPPSEKQPQKPLLPAGVLGRTKYPVTLVSFGAILLAGKTGTRVLKMAIDRGVNLVHTSQSYGRGKSTQAVGDLFKTEKRYRDKVLLCVKSFHPEKESEIDDMLRTLGTDHVEVAMTELHKPDPKRLEAIQRQQDNLKKKGKVRYTGFVCHSDMNDVMELVLDKAPGYFDVALMAMKLVPGLGTPEGKAQAKGKRFLENLGALRKKRIGILSIKSGARDAVTKGAKVFQPHVKAYLEAGADSILTSMNSFGQVEMISGLDLKSPHLTPAERKAAAEFHKSQAGTCLMCGDCAKACPQKLPVSDLMRFRMYHEEYGWPEHARAEYAALGVDFNRSARNCGDCSACADVCPVGLAGPQTVRRAASLFA